MAKKVMESYVEGKKAAKVTKPKSLTPKTGGKPKQAPKTKGMKDY